MAFEMMAWAMRQKTGKPANKAVLMAMCNYSDEFGVCYPSAETIAKITEQSVKTVRRAIDDLIEGNFIKITGRRRRKDGTLSVYEYQILTSGHFVQSPEQPVDILSSSPVDILSTRNLSVSETVSNKKNTKKDFADEFEIFWNEFPRQRRGNKHKAWIAWKAATQRASPGEILEGLRRYAVSQEVLNGYAKGAAAWLNDDRWANDYNQHGEQNGKSARADRAMQEFIQEQSDSGSGQAELRHIPDLRKGPGEP